MCTIFQLLELLFQTGQFVLVHSVHQREPRNLHSVHQTEPCNYHRLGSINHTDHKIQLHLLFFNFSIFFWFPHICFTCFFSVWKMKGHCTAGQTSTVYKLTILTLIKFASRTVTHQKWMCANFHNSVSNISGDIVIKNFSKQWKFSSCKIINLNLILVLCDTAKTRLVLKEW